jgi:hypothetical protein
MRSLHKLGIAAVLGLAAVSNFSEAGFFSSNFDEGKDYITLEGRAAFYEPAKKFARFMYPGRDEIGLFTGDVCVGSTSEVSSLWSSHYDGLEVNKDVYAKMLSGEIDFSIKAYNSQTNTIWTNSYPMSFRDKTSLDVIADRDLGYIPEPSTLSLLALGAFALKKNKKN